MKKIMVLAVAAFAAAACLAAPSWALVNTEGANGETSGYVERYAVYLCTTDASVAHFGGAADAEGVTAYLAGNYAAGMDALARDVTAFTLAAYGYDEGVYSFTAYFRPGVLVDGNYYVAVVTYAGEQDMFRVFNSAASGGTLTFDPVTGFGSAGAWTPVPEPTGGLLLLCGLAGLALRRPKK